MNGHNQPDSSTTGRHIPALDGIRGLAILLVLAEHLLWSNPLIHAPRWVLMILALHLAGWVGVDLFFVLSGFLITGILYDTLRSRHFFRNFYARRALRIFPVYYAFLLLLFLASRLGGWHWNTNVLYVLTYTENLFVRGPVTDAWWVNINHLWSLAIEEQFYLIWPVLIFVLRTPRRIAGAACIGALASFGLRLYLWHSPQAASDPYLLYSWTPARLDGLLTGALLAMGVRSRFRDSLVRLGRPMLVAGLAVLLLLYLRYPGFPFYLWVPVAVFVPFVLAITFSSMIAAALRPGGHTQRFFSTRTLRFYGQYSYGLYVFHPTIASFTAAPLRALFRAMFHSKGLAVLLEAAVTLGISVLAAWLSFHYFEQRCLRLKYRFRDTSQRPKLHEYIPDEDRAEIAIGQ